MMKKTRYGLPATVGLLVGRSMRLAARDRKPRLLEIALTHRCAGGCSYCFASGRPTNQEFIDFDVVCRVLDDASKMGMRMLFWLGGDPLYHPQWIELVRYAARLRMAQVVASSGLISRTAAKKLVALKEYINVSIHLDTVDVETYTQINRHPPTRDGKIRGYETLLAAGFPKERISGQMTLVQPVVKSFENTLDWFIQMGASFVLIRVFKPVGMGQKLVHLEPSLKEVEYCLNLRDSKFGVTLPFKPIDVGPYLCRTNVGIHPDGEVTPCLFLSNQGLGNVNNEKFCDIVAEHRDQLFFNYVPSGPCGECDYHHDPEISCMGCRVNALAYTGNIRGSDPKCWLNPEAPMYCLT